MPEVQLPEIRLYFEERGSGTPILLIHGSASDADTWSSAAGDLADLGRVIAYDRRGFTRSEQPEPYLQTTPREHADDAAALLERLEAIRAIVIGRSFGGDVALYLALNYPEYVLALVLLEGGSDTLSHALAPEMVAFLDELATAVRAAVDEHGLEAAGETLLRGVIDDDDFQAIPGETRARLAANGAAILAETECFQHTRLDPARLREITCPVLVVAASSSPPPLRVFSEALVAALPGARLALVEGGHMMSPSGEQVLSFLREVIDGS